MREFKQVAVMVETSRAYGRGILRGVSRFHHESKSWAIYFEPKDLGRMLPPWFKTWQGDGILARLSNKKAAAKLMDLGVPIIDLRGTLADAGIPPFGIDNTKVAQEAYIYLSSRGLTNFGFVGEPEGQHFYDDQRKTAFIEIVNDHGGDCRVFRQKLSRKARTWERQQQELADWLVAGPKPIGIFCCHDDRGQQVLNACRKAEIGVPDEVAVLGVDNDEYCCSLSIPSLSSIDTNCDRIGYEAAKLLDALMRKEQKFDKGIVFEPAGIVERQSTDVVACDDSKIAYAMRIIRQHACQHLAVSEVERQIGLSHTAFNRRFRKVIGRSPKQEITRLQIERAKQLAIDTDLPIYEISEKAGFTEAKYFISVFRKYTGVTPRAYRNLHGR